MKTAAMVIEIKIDLDIRRSKCLGINSDLEQLDRCDSLCFSKKFHSISHASQRPLCTLPVTG